MRKSVDTGVHSASDAKPAHRKPPAGATPAPVSRPRRVRASKRPIATMIGASSEPDANLTEAGKAELLSGVPTAPMQDLAVIDRAAPAPETPSAQQQLAALQERIRVLEQDKSGDWRDIALASIDRARVAESEAAEAKRAAEVAVGVAHELQERLAHVEASGLDAQRKLAALLPTLKESLTAAVRACVAAG